LELVLATRTYGLDFKRHKIIHHIGIDFEYQGWETCKEWGWEEKDLHYPSVTSCYNGFFVGKGFRIQDMKTIWRRIPGPATKFVGSKRPLFSYRSEQGWVSYSRAEGLSPYLF
jgi:hypothetical protein